MNENTKQEESKAEKFYEFAMLFFAVKKYKVAKHYMRTAIKLEPTNIKYHEAYKDMVEAIEIFEKAGIPNPTEFDSITIEELFGGNKKMN